METKRIHQGVYIKRYLTVLVAILSLVGCFHGERITEVHPDMSFEEVKAIMGPPEGYRKDGDYEVYSYYNKIISGWAWDRADYHYIVKDGKVVQYGAGEIRQNQKTGVLFIVPIR
jgi:hypothetical protein